MTKFHFFKDFSVINMKTCIILIKKEWGRYQVQMFRKKMINQHTGGRYLAVECNHFLLY